VCALAGAALSPVPCLAQQQGAAPGPPVAQAARTTGPIVVDGVLNESDWERAAPLTGFTQRLPAEGAPASQPTEVRIV